MIEFLRRFLKLWQPVPELHVAYDSGGRDKPTIVLIHGIAATSKTWDLLLKRIDTETYRVITLDLLGFGKSPKPTNCNYTVFDHSRSIHKTLNRLKIRGQIKLVGHSMGSIIAADYARRYSKQIQSLFLLSLPLYFKQPELHSKTSKRWTDIYIKMYQAIADKKQWTIKTSQSLRKLLRVSDGIDVTEANWHSFRLSLINTIVNQNSYEDIKRLKIPVQIIYGSLDEFLVSQNIDQLKKFKNVKITRLLAVDHSIGLRFAKVAADLIQTA
jgi:pimeloyl-ACP methyl ester carboxylesterase